MVAGGRDRERRRLVIGVRRVRRLVLADGHPIHLQAHDLRPDLVVPALRRAQAERVRSRRDVGRLRHLATAVLQEGDLRALRRRRIAAGEGRAVATDAGAAGKDPGRSRGRILEATAYVGRLEAAVGDSGRRDHLRQRRTARRGIAGIAAVVGDDAVHADGETAGGAGRGPAVAGAGERDGTASGDRRAAVGGEADVARRVRSRSPSR